MPSHQDDLKQLILRDLRSLEREVALYPQDSALWEDISGCPNSGGNLVQHLCGNLRHYIGAVLGHSGYVRQRDLEFSSKEATRAQLSEIINATRAEVSAAFENITAASLDERYPEAVGGRAMSTHLFLTHLAMHLTFHLGQIDYHRRATTGDTTSAKVVQLAEIGESAS